MKGINYATRKLKEDIVELINGSGLPITNICYVLESVWEQAKGLEDKAILEETAAAQEGGEPT